jgi:hypothetical protein
MMGEVQRLFRAPMKLNEKVGMDIPGEVSYAHTIEKMALGEGK